jgi:hypothetical protein
MVTGYGSNTFGGGGSPFRLRPNSFRIDPEQASQRSPNHAGFGVVSGSFYVLYLRHETLGWNLCKALEWRGFSRIAQTRERLKNLYIQQPLNGDPWHRLQSVPKALF